MNDNEDVLKKFDEIAAQWEREDPGVTDVDTPPHGASEHEMALPGLDLSNHESAGEQPQEPVPSESKPPEPPSEPWARVKYEMEQQKSAKPSADPLESKMREAGWAPKEQRAPLDFEKLQSDLQAAEHSANATRIGQQSFQAVAPSFHADSNAGAAEVAAAKAPLEVEQQRQAMEAKQQAADEERLAAGKKARLDDPTSTESRREQEAFRQLFPDSRRIPAGLDKMSANELAALRPSLVTLTGQDTTAGTAKGKEDAAATAKAAADKAKADASEQKLTEEKTVVDALRETAKKSPRLGELGLKPEDLEKLDRKALEEVDRNLRDLPGKKPSTGPGAPAKAVKSADDISDPGDRAAVQRILDGRDDAAKYGRKDGPRLAKLAAQINPSYDSTVHGTYADIAKKTAEDPQIQSAITMKKHFANALEHLPDNFDANGLNRIANAIKTNSGWDGMTEFETDVALGSGEMAKGIGENAEHGKELVRHLLDPNQSRGQLEKRLHELVKLQDEALDTKRQRFESAAPKGTALPSILRREEKQQPLETRGTKTGGTAFRARSGANRWFTTAEEAEAH